ncbi:hypothetical protein NDU88_010022 [Pleurodeles waltl]|uniref:Reverse transcriptase n=1 Tax=Pleurodeles waltl TaxID=8319 RepID=A0AAV7QWA8_PLEWA|nr:hypothetical protein NDU88_010022 [Pleurodeles waltl]
MIHWSQALLSDPQGSLNSTTKQDSHIAGAAEWKLILEMQSARGWGLLRPKDLLGGRGNKPWQEQQLRCTRVLFQWLRKSPLWSEDKLDPEKTTEPPPMKRALLLNCTWKILKDTPPKEIGLYHPISLIIADAKIVAKILAARLAPLMSGLVLYYPHGFIPGCDTTAYVSTAIIAFDSAENAGFNIRMTLLDAEKAFD